MLNRLFIAIGVLVILAIGGAFLLPRFIQWGDYRGRLETMAAQAFGAQVAIEGDIQLTLLPQPKIEFTKVRVGPAAAPAMQVDKVEAEFSLLDFLRDQYKVTRLELDHPAVNLALAADGSLGSGFAIAAGSSQSNVSIADADVVDGTVTLADARAGKTYDVGAINGQVKVEALQGPYSFQGTTNLSGVGYAVRISSGKLDDSGATTLSLYLKAVDDSFTLESSGALQTGATPKYTGDLTYRRPPPKPADGQTADAGRGDLVLQGKLEAASDRVLLTSYTLLPDENRSSIRLTGAAEMKLGKDVSFNAVLSGSVIALPPRDATKELTDPPYELVRLLGETPLPPIPGIPGTIGLDITELNLRAVSLRGLQLDATTDAKSWTIKDFAATLPGGTKVGLTGNLGVVDGHPIFAGGVTLDTQQLDRLAALWRKPTQGNPLFNMPGSLSADVALSSDRLALSSGTLVVAGINQGFDAEIGFGATRDLKVDAHFTTLGQEESDAIGALMPDLTANGSFGSTFPKGQISLSASKAVLFGLDGTELAADATWDGGVLEFSKLSAADLGGTTFDAKLTAFGTLTKPELSGTATVKVEDGAPALAQLLSGVNTPQAVKDFLGRSLPADLTLQLDAPAGDGGQSLNVNGRLGTADAKLTAKLGAGIVSALTAPITADLDMTSQSPHLMTAQLGLGQQPLFDERTPLHLKLSVEGVPSNSYQTHVRLEGGDDSIVFTGDVVPGDFTRIAGQGDIEATLTDPSALVDAAGAGGIYVPPLKGKATLVFEGANSLRLDGIDAGGITGNLSLTRLNGTATIGGDLAVPTLDIKGLLPLLAGASGTVPVVGDLWPEGPIDIGAGPRTTEGRIDVSVAALTAGTAPLVSNAKFGLDWDAQSVHLQQLIGATGGGTLSFDASVCCSNGQSAKQITGRLALSGVALDAVAPAAIGAGLDGKVEASAEFNGSGASLAEAMGAMTGTGSYTISDFSAAHFDPATFKDVGALPGVLDMDPDVLTATVTDKIADAPFTAPSVTGTFTIAGGVLRSPNLAIDGAGSRIFGGATLSLKDLALDARYAMSPTDTPDATSLVDPTSAELAAVVTGPLWAPSTSYDVASLVAGMKIKASEAELAVLEQRKAEADARAKAAADEAARLAAQQAADDAAKKAAADQAAKQAAADAAAKKAAAAAAASNDLGL